MSKWIKTSDRKPQRGEYIFIKDTASSDIFAGEVIAFVGEVNIIDEENYDEIILIKLSTGRFAHFETEYRLPTKLEMMAAL